MSFVRLFLPENLQKPADLSQRVIFKAKTSKPDKSSDVEKVDENPKKKEKSKKSVIASKLSFDLDDEGDDYGE